MKSPDKDGGGSDRSAPCQVKQGHSWPIEALLPKTAAPKKPVSEPRCLAPYYSFVWAQMLPTQSQVRTRWRHSTRPQSRTTISWPWNGPEENPSIHVTRRPTRSLPIQPGQHLTSVEEHVLEVLGHLQEVWGTLHSWPGRSAGANRVCNTVHNSTRTLSEELETVKNRQTVTAAISTFQLLLYLAYLGVKIVL